MVRTIKVYPVGSGMLTDLEKRNIADWHHREFDHLSVTSKYEWTVGGHYNVLLYLDNEMVGYVGVLRREVLINGETRLIGAIRGLVVQPAYRSQGLARQLMVEAEKVIFLGFKAFSGLLLCLPDLVGFYEKSGWQELNCEVIAKNKGRDEPWSEAAMIKLGSDQLQIASVNLNGPVF